MLTKPRKVSNRRLSKAELDRLADKARESVAVGDGQVKADDRDAAKYAYLEALGIFEKLVAADPGNAGWQHELAIIHNRIGDALDDHEAARGEYQKALLICEKLVAADPGNTGWQHELAVSHDRIGAVLFADDDPAALDEYDAAFVIVKRLVAADPANALWQDDLTNLRQTFDMIIREKYGESIWKIYTNDSPLSEADDTSRFRMLRGKFGESIWKVYNNDSPPSPVADTQQQGMEENDLNTAVKKTKAEILARGSARPATLQLATYKALVKKVDLLNPNLPDAERLRRAKRLVKAYGRVRERRPKFHDKHKQLQAAFSIVNRDQYQRTGKPKREAAKKLALG